MPSRSFDVTQTRLSLLVQVKDRRNSWLNSDWQLDFTESGGGGTIISTEHAGMEAGPLQVDNHLYHGVAGPNSRGFIEFRINCAILYKPS